jgi:hypothetical protein
LSNKPYLFSAKTPSTESQDMENIYKKRVLELELQVLNLKNENEAITMELNNVVEEENNTGIANTRNSMDMQSSSHGLISNKISRQDASYTKKKQVCFHLKCITGRGRTKAVT